MDDDLLTATQQINITEKEREQDRQFNRRVKTATDAAIRTKTECTPGSHANNTELGLLAVEGVQIVRADVRATRIATGATYSQQQALREDFTKLTETVTYALNGFKENEKKKKGTTVPLPLFGKVYQFPAKYALAMFALMLLFAWGIIHGDHISDVVEAINMLRRHVVISPEQVFLEKVESVDNKVVAN